MAFDHLTSDNQSGIDHPRVLDSQDPIIQVENATKVFGKEVAVDGVTFDVPRGSIFGLIGPSGTGKTTMVRMLTGIYSPTGGEIRVFNMDPTKFTQEQRAKIGYMPQLFVLYPNLTVWENINFTASIYGMKLNRSSRLKEILKLVELESHSRKLARNNSGGMQRRLSLASALVHSPELLFLDEPTAGIDPVLRHKFWQRFKELQNEGRTLLITTQYVNEADNCDLVGVILDGKLLLVDTPTGLRHHAYGGEIVDLQAASPIDIETEQRLNAMSRKIVRLGPKSMRIIVDQASTAIPDLMELANSHNLKVETLEQYLPPFEEVFIELVRSEKSHE